MNVLLPASGLGQRNRAEGPVKELLIRQGLGGSRPLIEFSFLHLLEPAASGRVKKIVILTRKEKLAPFEAWLQAFKQCLEWKAAGSDAPSVEFFIHEPSSEEEWPRTLLASRHLWSEKNLILLPDTQLMLPEKLRSTGLVGLFDLRLETLDTLWAVSRMESAATVGYGVISETSQGLTVTEKPKESNSNKVWGCFGFRRAAGASLLQKLEESTHSHRPFALPQASGLVDLESFSDLSRNG